MIGSQSKVIYMIYESRLELWRLILLHLRTVQNWLRSSHKRIHFPLLCSKRISRQTSGSVSRLPIRQCIFKGCQTGYTGQPECSQCADAIRPEVAAEFFSTYNTSAADDFKHMQDNFSFCHNVLKSRQLQMHHKASTNGKGFINLI